jgi:hypothetical protein
MNTQDDITSEMQEQQGDLLILEGEPFGLVARAATMDKRLSNGAFRLLAHLLTYASASTGVCWPGQERLAAELRVSGRTILRQIGELERAGWLERHKRVRVQGDWKGNPNACVYRVKRAFCAGCDTDVTSDVTPVSPEHINRTNQKKNRDERKIKASSPLSLSTSKDQNPSLIEPDLSTFREGFKGDVLASNPSAACENPRAPEVGPDQLEDTPSPENVAEIKSEWARGMAQRFGEMFGIWPRKGDAASWVAGFREMSTTTDGRWFNPEPYWPRIAWDAQHKGTRIISPHSLAKLCSARKAAEESRVRREYDGAIRNAIQDARHGYDPERILKLIVAKRAGLDELSRHFNQERVTMPYYEEAILEIYEDARQTGDEEWLRDALTTVGWIPQGYKGRILNPGYC